MFKVRVFASLNVQGICLYCGTGMRHMNDSPDSERIKQIRWFRIGVSLVLK